MKKILLATTVLVGTAGFAAAESHGGPISFSGSAAAGIASDAGGDFDVYNTATLDVAMSGSTDSGLEFGTSLSVSVGDSYTFADDDGFNAEDGIVSGGEVWIKGSFGTVSFDRNGYGFFHNDDSDTDQGDVKWTGEFAGVSVGVIADVQDVNDVVAGVTENTNDLSAQLGYTIAGVTLGANVDGTDNIEWDVSASYTMGSITASAGYNHDSVANVKVAFAGANGLSASAAYDTDSNYDLTAGYTIMGVALAASYGDNLDVADQTWEVTAGYDLGGGLMLKAGYNYTNDAFVGAEMSF